MVETILRKYNRTKTEKLVIKAFLSTALLTLALLLPQFVHMVFGANGGVQLLPMYLPVLLGGCLLGVRFGLCIGIAAPIVSFTITALSGNPMPTAAKLPFLIVELSVFAVVSGTFSKKISSNPYMAIPAVIIAAFSGRITFILMAILLQSTTNLSPALAWTQVQLGLPGILLQIVLVPVTIILLAKHLNYTE